jgi:hypothetical protein
VSRREWVLLGVLALVVVVVFRSTIRTAAESVGGYVVDVVVKKIATAIARAEGFYVPGSVPARLHNPGDLTLDITGKGVGKNGMYVVYASDADGWEALEKQVRMMLDGSSRIYNPSMTIAQMAARYTSTEVDSWAMNVARSLGATTQTQLRDIA